MTQLDLFPEPARTIPAKPRHGKRRLEAEYVEELVETTRYVYTVSADGKLIPAFSKGEAFAISCDLGGSVITEAKAETYRRLRKRSEEE